jgi:FtsP/CotA-like multicopper oxidase with cupredoxin domain
MAIFIIQANIIEPSQMSRLRAIIAISVIASILSSVFAILVSSNQFSVFAQDNNNSNKKIVGGHATGYSTYETTGDLLDPINNGGKMSSNNEVVIDPDKYLRSFSYGHNSTTPNGTTVREFTLIADDRQTMEISPGVSYNVWTFNGTVPGPTLRATEGDLI